MTTAPRNPVPVFPLPSLVLFPHVAMPLHLFELRYRALIRDVLAGERVFAMATLEPGWEADYHGSPAFHPIGNLMRIDAVEWRPDDEYDLQVTATTRVRFTATVREYPYRACEVEVLRTAPYDEADAFTAIEREALLRTVRDLLPRGPEVWVQPPRLEPASGFEALVSEVAFVSRLSPARKLEVLAIDSVLDRSRHLGELLRGL